MMHIIQPFLLMNYKWRTVSTREFQGRCGSHPHLHRWASTSRESRGRRGPGTEAIDGNTTTESFGPSPKGCTALIWGFVCSGIRLQLSVYIYIKLVASVCFLTLKGNPTELNKMSFVRLNNMGLDPKLLKINVYCYILLLYVFYSLYMRKYD